MIQDMGGTFSFSFTEKYKVFRVTNLFIYIHGRGGCTLRFSGSIPHIISSRPTVCSSYLLVKGRKSMDFDRVFFQ